MYKITKTVNNLKTINLIFDDTAEAKEIFDALRYDEFVRFKKLYVCEINRENIEHRIDSDTIYKEYRISVPTFSVTITLTYIKD